MRNRIVIPREALMSLWNSVVKGDPEQTEVNGRLDFRVERNIQQKSPDDTMLKLKFEHDYRKIRINLQ